jgi:hypothetical protein
MIVSSLRLQAAAIDYVFGTASGIQATLRPVKPILATSFSALWYSEQQHCLERRDFVRPLRRPRRYFREVKIWVFNPNDAQICKLAYAGYELVAAANRSFHFSKSI